MEARPKQNEHTVQEAADILGVGQHWLFTFLKTNGHLEKRNTEYLIPTGTAAANGYITIREGQHHRPGIGMRQHYRPVITPEGMRWLVQEVAKAQIEEQQQQGAEGCAG